MPPRDSLMRKFLTPPTFEDEERTQTARALHIILWALILTVTPFFTLQTLLLPGTILRFLLAICAIDGLSFILLGLTRRGATRLTSIVLIGALGLIITALVLTAGNTQAPAFTAYLVLIAVTGALLGQRASVITAAVISLVALGIAYLELTGQGLPNMVTHTPLTRWISLLLFMALLVGVQYLATSVLQKALQRAQIELGERQRAEAALRASEARLRAAIENIPFEFWSCDAERRYVVQNAADLRRWGNQIGHTPDENPAKSQEQKAAWRALLDRAWAGEVVRHDYALPAAAQTVYFDSLITPVHDTTGQITSLVGINIDITERKQAEVALHHLAERLETLHTIDRALLTAESLDAITLVAVENVRQLVGCQRVSVSLFDFQTQHVLLPAVSSATPTAVASGSSITFDDFGADIIEALRQRQICAVEDVTAGPPLTHTDQRLLAEGVRAWLYMPLFYQAELIGSLNLGDVSPQAFTPEQTDIAREVADQLAVAIQQNKLLEATRRQVRELSAVHLVATACAEAASEYALLEQVTHIIGETFFAENFGVLLVDEAHGVLRVHPTYRGILDEIRVQTIPLGERVVGTVAVQGRPWRIDNVSTESQYVSVNSATQSQLCVPLKAGERVIGVINADSSLLNAFSAADERLLITAAGQLASALARLRAETALRESEALYRRAIEVADAVPYYIDHATNTYQFIGTGIERLTGYAPAEITPRVWRALIEETHVLGEAAQLSREEADRLAHAGQLTMWRADSRIRTRAGETRWVNNSSVEILGEPGTSIGAIGILQDITERKHAEEAIRRLNENLEGQVAWRTEELNLANEALVKAAQLKDEFLAGMSHELRTPLTGILAFAQTLQKPNVYGPLTEKQLRAVKNIEDSGRHLLELINDVLDLSKIEAGRMELEPQTGLVEDICQASLRLVKQMAATKHQTVAYHAYPLGAQLTVDARRLKQMLVNLLSNAIKFTPEGGALGLEVSGDSAAQVMRLTVWDTGIGIAPEDLPRLFQVFVQLDSSLSRQQTGTGLGLALVRRMAELHGGGVSVESEVGRGSRFTISLPWLTVVASPSINATPGHPPTPAGLAEAAPLNRPHLLLAEDNAVNIQVLTDYLEASGYALSVARNGYEAVQLARELRPQLILMDIQMPGMDGLEATRHLRRDPALAKVPIIALTALAMPGDRERCLAAGANDYLTKPVNLEQLVDKIRDLLG